MHELSIVENIIDITQKKAIEENFSIVKKIIIDIGELSCVSIEALEFCFDVACKNTVLERAELIVNSIKGMAKCKQCDIKFTLENIYDLCPQCDNNDIIIIAGKETRIKSLLV